MRENYFGTIRVFQQIFVAFSHKTNCENETFFVTSRMMIKVLKIQEKKHATFTVFVFFYTVNNSQ